MATTIDVFNPLCFENKKTIEKKLFENFKDDENIIYQHPFSDREMCIFDVNNKKFHWERYNQPLDISNLLDISENLATKEDRIFNNIKTEKFLDALQLKNKRISIQSIPQGQEILKCCVDESGQVPPLFVVSKYKNYPNSYYFDLVVHDISSNEPRDDYIPLYYANRGKYPFKHSSDIVDQSRSLMLHYFSITSRDRNAKGIITAHAYNKKSFIDIESCDPNLCLIDCYSPNEVKLYLIHFSLSRDFVGNSSICHLTRFEYKPEEKKIYWYIPQPVFDDKKINVGCSFGKYKDKVNEFNSKVNNISKRLIKEKSTMIIKRKNQEEEEEEEEEEKPTLIIQKPLINEKACGNIIEKILMVNKQNNNNIYTFHRNISKLDDDDDDDEDNYKYSLPIAGGSIVSEKPIVKLGKPIKKKETAKKFQHFLYRSKRRAIVILADKSSMANMPKVSTKMDAIYIVIALNEDHHSNKNIEEKLNNVDTSLAITMQGSLSTIIVYLPLSTQTFYHYRGVGENKKFGQIVTLQEIFQQQQQQQRQPRPLISHAFPPPLEWCVYSRKGEKLFEINENEDDAKSIISKIIIRNNNNDELKHIFAQLEVNLDPKIFKEMMDIIVQRVAEKQRISQRSCLEMILENAHAIVNCPKKEIRQYLLNLNDDDDDCYYSKKWLTDFLAKLMKFNCRREFLSKYEKTLQQMCKILKTYNNNELLYEILNDSVSMRSSYGLRKKGLNQMVRNRQITKNCQFVEEMTEDDMDNYLENNCSEDGAILLVVNKQHFLTNNNKLKALTNKIDDFDRSSRELVSCYLDGKSNQFNFTYKDNNMVIIPMLTKLKEAMKRPDKYPWREIETDGPIDKARIIFRKTIYELLPTEIQRQYTPGSPIVGKIAINVLFSAIYSLAGNRRDFSSSSESDGWINQFRCITGLILSLMASGSNTPLSLAYQTVLYTNEFVNCKINFAGDDGVWVKNLFDIWPFLKLDHVVDVKTNISNCLYYRVQNCIRALKCDDDKEDVKLKKQRELRKKSQWLYNTIRPMVMCILRDFKGQQQQQSSLIIEDICSRKEKESRKQISDKIQYFQLNVDKVKEVLETYNKLKNHHHHPSSLNNKSYFFKILDSFQKSYNNNNNDKVRKLWAEINSVALEIYLKRSSLVTDQLSILLKYLEENDKNSLSKRRVTDLKFSIIHNILQFKTPLYHSTKLPKILINLSKCEKVKDYYTLLLPNLKNFISDKSNEGHFMSNRISEEEEDEEEERRKRKEAMIINIINQNENISSMIYWINQTNLFSFNLQQFIKNELCK